MALLYSGLEPAAAGDVIAALDQQGVPYEVRGTSLFVPESQRDSLRMSLAAQNLPANSALGYEILDQLTGFGTTSQMFDAAYWRAKEGELARTIVSNPAYRSARVHISSPSVRPFQRDLTPTASVTVVSQSGGLTPEQARAIRFLVASAVAGLLPKDVAVIDADSGLVTEGDTASGGVLATDLQARAERLLAARVGPGNAVVEVSVETNLDTETVIERQLDPASRIAISTNVEERTTSSQDGSEGAVTVASNLPDGEAGADAATQSAQSSETREVTNFEVSETSRERVTAPGAIKRLTVAVLVNDIVTIGADGTPVVEPRSPEELALLEELVASAVGINPDRGDLLTVRSIPFEPVAAIGTEAVASSGASLDLMSLIKLAVLAVVALILGLFVVRPVLAPRGPTALPAPASLDRSMARATPDPDERFEIAGGPPLIEGRSTGVDDTPEDAVARLRRLIEERQDDAVRVLQSWIEDPEDRKQS
jgi:flagellar M-ring protein FliF